MKAEQIEPKLMSITDVAKRWTTTRQNIWNMCRDGRLPATMIGSRWYVIFDSVLEMEQPTNTPEKENEDLETLIDCLYERGSMTKDEINKFFSGHLVGDRGKKFNEAIKDSELITMTKESTSGRPKEIYSLAEPSNLELEVRKIKRNTESWWEMKAHPSSQPSKTLGYPSDRHKKKNR